MITFGVNDFFGSMLFLPVFIYLALALLDGIGLIARDPFFISRNRKRL